MREDGCRQAQERESPALPGFGSFRFENDQPARKASLVVVAAVAAAWLMGIMAKIEFIRPF